MTYAWSEAAEERARQIIGSYPEPRSAMMPLLYIAMKEDLDRGADRLTEDGMRARPERLERLFGVIDPQSAYSKYRQQQVEIQCDVPTTDAGLDNVVVEVSYELDHGLNVCAFRFLQGLDDIEPAPPARDAIAKLDATLAETATRGRDHYRSLIGRGA